MSRMLKAYCEDKGIEASISIDEAIEYYFAQDPQNRHRFTFTCSDRHCKVPVMGVNYDKKIMRKSPCFSRIKAHPHKLDCMWNSYDTFMEKVRKGQISPSEFSDSNLFKSYAKDVAEFIVDVYTPSIMDVERTGGSRTTKREGPSEGGDSHWAKTYKHRTSLIMSLVDAYLSMTDGERASRYIEIATKSGTRKMRYSDAFIQASCVTPLEFPKVIYGKAKIYKYGNENFKIIFTGRNFAYKSATNDSLTVAAIIEMSSQEANTPFGRKLVEAALQVWQDREGECECYIFGTPSLETAELKKGKPDPCLVIKPMSIKEIDIR